MSYNNKNELSEVENSKGTLLVLQYDDKGNINYVRTNKLTLDVIYNDKNKAEWFGVTGVGEVVVTYDIHGAIETTESPGGDEMVQTVSDIVIDIADALLDVQRDVDF